MENTTAPDTIADTAGLLYGMPAISAFLGLSPRQGYHLAQKAEMPTFKLSGVVCARIDSLKAWLADQEGKARKAAA